MLIAQVTDTHIKADNRLAYGRVDTRGALARCVAHLNALQPLPDIALVTGDLADTGKPAEYAVLRGLLDRLAMPYYVIAGNHDDRGAMREAFADHSYVPSGGEFFHYAIEDFPLRLIGLDSTIPGRAEGKMCAARLEWLDERLREAPRRPTLLFIHHPPFVTGIDHMDVQRCKNAAAFGSLVERNPQVVRLLCGHVHRAIQVPCHGIPASIGPSHTHAVALDLQPQGPPAYVMEPPLCELHRWTPEHGVVSYLSFVEAYDGPYPFCDEAGRLID